MPCLRQSQRRLRCDMNPAHEATASCAWEWAVPRSWPGLAVPLNTPCCHSNDCNANPSTAGSPAHPRRPIPGTKPLNTRKDIQTQRYICVLVVVQQPACLGRTCYVSSSTLLRRAAAGLLGCCLVQRNIAEVAVQLCLARGTIHNMIRVCETNTRAVPISPRASSTSPQNSKT